MYIFDIMKIALAKRQEQRLRNVLLHIEEKGIETQKCTLIHRKIPRKQNTVHVSFLTVFLIQQFNLHQNVGSHFGKPNPCILPASQYKSKKNPRPQFTYYTLLFQWIACTYFRTRILVPSITIIYMYMYIYFCVCFSKS